jgi:hypothetical protein
MVALPGPPPRLVGHDGVFGKHARNAHSEDCAPYKEEPAAEVCCCFVAGRQSYRNNPVKSHFSDRQAASYLASYPDRCRDSLKAFRRNVEIATA